MLKEHVDVFNFNDTLIRCFVYFQNVRFRYKRKAKKNIFSKIALETRVIVTLKEV